MNAIKVLFRAAAVAALVLAGVLPARAQTLTGSLSGTVVDSSDAVLPGATVTLINDLSGDQRSTVTRLSPGDPVTMRMGATAPADSCASREGSGVATSIHATPRAPLA